MKHIVLASCALLATNLYGDIDYNAGLDDDAALAVALKISEEEAIERALLDIALQESMKTYEAEWSGTDEATQASIVPYEQEGFRTQPQPVPSLHSAPVPTYGPPPTPVNPVNHNYDQDAYKDMHMSDAEALQAVVDFESQNSSLYDQMRIAQAKMTDKQATQKAMEASKSTPFRRSPEARKRHVALDSMRRYMLQQPAEEPGYYPVHKEGDWIVQAKDDPMPKNGSCLFHAIARQTGNDAEELRKEVAYDAYQKALVDQAFCRSLLNEHARYTGSKNLRLDHQQREALENYHSRMAGDDSVWGGESEMKIVAEKTKRPIIITARQDGAYPVTRIIGGEHQGHGEPIYLVWENSHYDALHVPSATEAR